MSSSMSDQQLAEDCYNKWMILQEERLKELMETLTLKPNNSNINNDDNNDDDEDDNKNENYKDARLKQVVERAIQDLHDYSEERSCLSHKRVSKFFAPTWNTSLENSLQWIGGCRPPSFLRLLYALCGSHTIAYVEELLRDTGAAHRSSCSTVVDDLSAEQLLMVNNLQMKTVREEDKLSERSACLQENAADIPIATIAYGMSNVREESTEAHRALDEHEAAMAELMAEADKLRINTLKELINILTPLQAVDFLAAGKKLQLCMHEWCKKRDQGFPQNDEVDV